MCKNFIVIPLDDRPVTYSLPQEIASINQKIKVFTPPREYLGNLQKYADVDSILDWLKTTTETNNIDYILCSLDTLIYGGLIPSRRIDSTLNDLLISVKKIKFILTESKKKSGSKIFAFSSIMRISNNNVNEEEKLYWDKYGEFIYEYSYLTHKLQIDNSIITKNKLYALKQQIPKDILTDYLKTRERNFEINKTYLNFAKENTIDYLVYCLDDTGTYGLNIKESNDLDAEINKNNLNKKVSIKTGSDEILLSLFTRALVENIEDRIYIKPIYSTPIGKDIISKYEDKTIENSIKGQIELAGCIHTENKQEANLIMLVHTPAKCQNDHAMRTYLDEADENSVKFCINKLKQESKPLILVDISHANGGDNNLIKELINQHLTCKLYAYSAWNTTGNALGSAIFTSINRYIAEKMNIYNQINFKKCLLIRLIDDWAYQALVRQQIRELTPNADIQLLNEKLIGYIETVTKELNIKLTQIKLSFPWKRTFEVEIDIFNKD